MPNSHCDNPSRGSVNAKAIAMMTHTFMACSMKTVKIFNEQRNEEHHGIAVEVLLPTSVVSFCLS